MNKSRLALVAFTTLAVFVVGCSDRERKSASTSPPAKKAKPADDDHDHGPMPHGGTLVEFGNWHAELLVDAKAKEATIYVLNPKGNTPAPVTADKLTLSAKKPAFQVDLKPAPLEGEPKGKSSKFVGTSEHFGHGHELEGTVTAVIDGTPYSGDFDYHPHKDGSEKK